jgi:drug/metabolite transporter (DMT)-like permease
MEQRLFFLRCPLALLSTMIDLEVSQKDVLQKDVSKSVPLALVTLCIALLAISFAPIFIRFSELELSAQATVFNRLAIFSLVFGAGRVVQQQFGKRPASTQALLLEATLSPALPPISLKEWVLLFGVGLISIFSLGLWATSLEYTSVAKSMLLNNLTPIFTTFGGWLFLKKRFDRRFLVGMAIALLGAIAMGFEDLNGASGFLLGDICALLSAVFLGSYFLVVEQLRNRFDATTILLWRCMVGSGCLLPLLLVSKEPFLASTPTTWLAVLGLGIICEGFGQRLLADSMDVLSSSFISLFLLLEPIISAVLAWFIFKEQLSPTTWIGFAVVLSGIYLANSSQSSMHLVAEPGTLQSTSLPSPKPSPEGKESAI